MNPGEWSEEQVRSVQTTLMVRLSAQGVPYRVIGRVLRTDASTVCRRLKALPVDQRRRMEHMNF